MRKLFAQKCDHTLEWGYKQYGYGCYVEDDQPSGVYQTAVTYVLNTFHCCSWTQFVIQCYDEVIHQVDLDEPDALERVFDAAVRWTIGDLYEASLVRIEYNRFVDMYSGFNAHMSEVTSKW